MKKDPLEEALEREITSMGQDKKKEPRIKIMDVHVLGKCPKCCKQSLAVWESPYIPGPGSDFIIGCVVAHEGGGFTLAGGVTCGFGIKISREEAEGLVWAKEESTPYELMLRARRLIRQKDPLFKKKRIGS